MAEVELTKMSSRGQIVIPQEIREKLHLKEGEAFAVTGSGDTLLLKKIYMPTKRDILKKMENLVRIGNKRVKKLGIKESDVTKITHRARGIKDD